MSDNFTHNNGFQMRKCFQDKDVGLKYGQMISISLSK